MNSNPLRRPILASLPILLALLASCGSPNKNDLDPGPTPREATGPPEVAPEIEPERPWTETFRSPAMLIADEIRVEGPKGLLDHIATRVEPDHHTYDAKTLPEGFCQTFELRRRGSGVEIRAYLDAFELVSMGRLILLERPGEVEVVVQARGDAYWHDNQTGAEQRGPLLTFRGE